MYEEAHTICGVFKDIAKNTVEMLRKNIDNSDYMVIIGTGVTGDISRRVDVEAENFVVEQIKDLGYNAWIISEERGVWKLHDKPEMLVLVDPLDGSLNYYLNIPFASVSIAVYNRSNAKIVEPIYGVVYSVFSDTVIEICNDVVFFNDKVFDRALNRGNEVVSIYTEQSHHLHAVVSKLEEKGLKVKTRTMGSAALEAAYAALGLIGHFVHVTGKLRNIDVPVGLAIARRLGRELYVEPSVDELKLDNVEVIRKVAITSRDSGLVEVVKQL